MTSSARRGGWLLALSVCALAVTLRAQEGNVLQVPGQYPTIQAAVDAASPGDYIHVGAAVYNENVHITTSNLHLRASRGAVIDGTGLVGAGVLIAGSASEPLFEVELAGFEIRNFQQGQGIGVDQAVALWIHRNDIHDNAGTGMDLRTVRSSNVSENVVHGNGLSGISVRMGSAHNMVRNNRVRENGGRSSDRSSTGIMVTGNLSDYNELTENEVIANNGWGIMISRPPAAPLTGTLVAQNRVHENARAGIAVMGSAVSGNTIVQNNATGNSIGGITSSPCYPFDLFDDAPVNNKWERNQGTAGVGLD